MIIGDMPLEPTYGITGYDFLLSTETSGTGALLPFTA